MYVPAFHTVVTLCASLISTGAGFINNNSAITGSANDFDEQTLLYRYCETPEEADWIWRNKNALMDAAGKKNIELEFKVDQHVLTFEAARQPKESLPPLSTDPQS
jgi:hypothetical protein